MRVGMMKVESRGVHRKFLGDPTDEAVEVCIETGDATIRVGFSDHGWVMVSVSSPYAMFGELRFDPCGKHPPKLPEEDSADHAAHEGAS